MVSTSACLCVVGGICKRGGNEKGGSARRGTALHMVSGQEVPLTRSLSLVLSQR